MKTFHVCPTSGAPFICHAEKIEEVMAAISDANVFYFDGANLEEAGWAYNPGDEQPLDSLYKTYQADPYAEVRFYEKGTDKRFIVKYL